MTRWMAVLSAVVFLGVTGCTSVESATVSKTDIAANGDAVAVVQASALGVTALFHLVDIVQSDLDVVVNRLLVSEAKAMGASRIDLKSAQTTPRHGVYRLAGFPLINIIGVTSSTAVGIAVQ